VLRRRASGAELRVERPCLALLDCRGDRGDRDRANAERAPRRGQRPAGAVIDDLEAVRREPAQPPPEAVPPARPREPHEAVLGLGVGHARHRDDCVEEHEQGGDAEQGPERAVDDHGRHRQREREEHPARS
jgi:hypothetical protein